MICITEQTRLLQVRHVKLHWKKYICIIIMCIVIFTFMFTPKPPAMKTSSNSKIRTHQLQFRPPPIKAAVIKKTTGLMSSSYSSLNLAFKAEVKRMPSLNRHINKRVTDNIKPTTIEATTISEIRTHQLQFRPPTIKTAVIKKTTELMSSSSSTLNLDVKPDLKKMPSLNRHINEKGTENIKPTLIETTTSSVYMETNAYTTTQSNFKLFNIKDIEDIMATKPIEFLPNYKNPCWYGTENNGPINDGKLHCLPYFYLIGMKKCGTTDLFARISAHPDFKSTGFKESQWFTRVRYNTTFTNRKTFYMKKGPTSSKLSYYVSIFDRAANDISKYSKDSSRNINPYITGEGTPGNLHLNPYWNQMPGNKGLTEPKYTILNEIKHLIPAVKMVVIFRDPVERAYSDYIFSKVHAARFKGTTPTYSAEEFHEVSQTSVDYYRECFKTYTMRRCLYNNTLERTLQEETGSSMEFHVGFYAFYLQELWNVIGKDNVLPLLFNNYSDNLEGTVNKVFEFLDLSPVRKSVIQSSEGKKNSRAKQKKESGAILLKTKLLLYTFFKPFNTELAKMLNDARYLFR